MKKLFCIVLAFFMLLNINCYAKSLSQLEQEANKIKKNSAQTNQLLNKAKSKKNTMQQEINNLDAELVKASAELISTSNKLEQTKKNLEKSEQELIDAQSKKEKQYAAYKQRIRFIYENGKNAYIHIIFKAHSFHDFLKRTEYVNYIIKYDSNLLDKLRESENEIAKKIDDIKSDQEQMKNLVEQEKKHKENLESRVKAKEELMNKLNSDVEKYQQQLKDFEDSSNNIERLIRQAQMASSNNSSASLNSTYSGGKLEWPLPGRTYISSGYGSRTSPISGRGEFHTGLDIPAPTGTPVHAAEDGVIINSGNINGYGYTIIINHGGGLSTLYGHNSRLIAKVGQSVKRGDIIALVGSTGYATGPHCHFEVRLNGKHTSPWNYLNR